MSAVERRARERRHKRAAVPPGGDATYTYHAHLAPGSESAHRSRSERPLMSTLGPLVPADETFHHQITDTFATVSQSDRSWTEKVCAMAATNDGSVQLAFGMGKYPNRGVIDAYAGVSRGKEQWTVRASRQLFPDVERLAVGPIAYDVEEPLRRVRFSLGPSDVVPISFEWTFAAVLPCVLEQPEQHRSRDGLRLDADIVRYHQIGTGSGWAEVDGTRYELRDETTVSTRDHSWGVRYMVGAPVADVEEASRPSSVSTSVMWSPMLCERADGSRYGLHTFYQRHSIAGWQRLELQGGVEHPDGRREPWVGLAPEVDVHDDNRRLTRAVLHFTMADGSERPITVTAVGDTGFHLGTGLYFGFDGHWHGEWRGPLHVDGEYIPDCSDPETARRVHQIRDNLVRVDDPVGGGVGYGNLQSIIAGPHPESGLTEDASFI